MAENLNDNAKPNDQELPRPPEAVFAVARLLVRLHFERLHPPASRTEEP